VQNHLEKPNGRALSTSGLLLAAGLLASFGACSGEPTSGSPAPPASTQAPVPSAAASAAAAAASAVASASPAAAGDPKHGAELAVKFECARCHDGLNKASTVPYPETAAADLTAADATKPDNKHCYHCHAAILDGRYQAPKPATTTRWKKNVEALRDVPTLTGAHKRFRRGWVEGFLLRPHDLRPRLAPTMPRLALTAADARDIAAFLVPDDPAGSEKTAAARPSAEGLREGRDLFEKKGCVSCHVLSGTAPLKGAAPAKQGERGITAAMRLAPDLRHARDRMTFDTVARWIKKPSAIKSDTLMPETALSEDELQKLAGFVTFEPLAPEEPKIPPARLAVLTRHVAYEEVKARVFNKICWHCHSDADYAIGDGGPGNTGGFGFPPRGLNLAAHDGILSGSLDDSGERRSIFEPMADGTPRLVASLVARWGEEAGKENPAIRGMPLGLPALSAEDLQLVETWISQGHSPD
jgi:cytochrome c5